MMNYNPHLDGIGDIPRRLPLRDLALVLRVVRIDVGVGVGGELALGVLGESLQLVGGGLQAVGGHL